ncbi:Cytolysin/lectin [Apodospora peruviana]|uniref:Cytolysin/lectin n=1 Tax=Apodospora peruviana TaxID=516989 RepID=A0AAE0I007_9PEZI|nr:Cytolysin/lectin [Apodospora peruviana]
MAYNINLRPLNDTSVTLSLVEKTCWQGSGTVWSTPGEGRGHFDGAYFAVAVGVHNYKRWCDVTVNLGDDQPLTKLHGEYYNSDSPKNKALWAQASEAKAKLKSGKEVSVGFYQKEGKQLFATLTFA